MLRLKQMRASCIKQIRMKLSCRQQLASRSSSGAPMEAVNLVFRLATLASWTYPPSFPSTSGFKRCPAANSTQPWSPSPSSSSSWARTHAHSLVSARPTSLPGAPYPRSSNRWHTCRLSVSVVELTTRSRFHKRSLVSETCISTPGVTIGRDKPASAMPISS